jgi:hypothetical protein
VKSAPRSVVEKSKFGSLELRVEQTAQKFITHVSLKIDVDRVAPDDYAEFRKFAQKVDKALSPRLVVGK